jgi:hypothetical protein
LCKQVASLKIELENATAQRDKSQDKELENAISKISNSNKDGSDTLKTYKNSFSILSILVRFKEAVKMPVAISMWLF